LGRPAFFSNKAIEERVAILEPLMGPSTPLRFAQYFGWWLKRPESASSWSPAFFAPDPLLLVSCTCCAAMWYQNGTMKRDF
jgi:hypothetical protein